MSTRALVLLLVSLIFMLSGLSILVSNLPGKYAELDPSIHAHLALLSVGHIGLMFFLVGLLGCTASFFTNLHLFGYVALQALSTFWGGLYIVSWIETGYWRSVFGMIQYILLIGILWIASRLVEVPKKLGQTLHKLTEH